MKVRIKTFTVLMLDSISCWSYTGGALKTLYMSGKLHSVTVQLNTTKSRLVSKTATLIWQVT